MEAVGENRESDEEPEQVRKGHPLVPQVGREVEPAKDQGMDENHREPGECDLESVPMDEGHSQKRQGEEDKRDRNAEEL